MFLPFEDEAAETLNSIMFLLILESFLCRCVRQPPLNSIMFLLILLADLEYHLVRQIFKFHYVSINSAPVHPSLLCPKSLNSIMFLLILKTASTPIMICTALNSIMFLLIPVPKPTAYLLHETPLFCRPLQNISFLSHSSSYVLATPPILAIFYFCRFPAFFTLSQVDRNHYIFIISSFLLA